jgi:alkyl hydroperoxide reductase subunit AhpC
VDIAWIKDIEEVGSTTMNFPIFSDTDRTVCEQFGMLMVSD